MQYHGYHGDGLKLVLSENKFGWARNVRKHVELEEVMRYEATATKIKEGKERGKTITMAGDSTTRKRVGKYAVGGIHIRKNEVLPLPTLSVTRETEKNVAATTSEPIEILAIASEESPEVLYEAVDVHMTDSVSHNRKISTNLQEKYKREKPAGQVFCNAHTSLGMIHAINERISEIEQQMGVNNIMKSVLVEVVYEKKHGSVLAQSVYSTLALVDKEHSAMSWNYHTDFLDFLKRHGIKSHLFPYKDSRFDGLPRACGVLLFHWTHIQEWLKERGDITNKLSCFIRALENVKYLQMSMAVVASFGLHLVEPYNVKIKDKLTNHTTLIEFYQKLLNTLKEPLNSAFFSFDKPVFPFKNETLPAIIKHTYTNDVAVKVRETYIHLTSISW